MTEWIKQNLSGQNGPNMTKVVQIGPKRPKADRIKSKWTEWTK